jgi:hypothetical protein
MAATVDVDVATALQAAGVGNYSAAGAKTIFRGPMRAEVPSPTGGSTYLVPHAALFVLEGEGPQPQAYLGDNTRVVARTPVQVMVRSNVDKFDEGLTTARAALAALHQKPPAGYIEARARGDRPSYLGKDSSDRHLWSINFEMDHVRTL